MIRANKSLKNKSFLFIGFGTLVMAALYPIWFSPQMSPKYYQDIQEVGRKGIEREKVQPGNMRVWSDPFERRK